MNQQTNKRHLEGIKFWIPRLSQRRPTSQVSISVLFQKSLVFPIQMCSSLSVNPGNQFQINSATSTKIIKNRRILPSLTMIGGVQLDMNHLAQPGPRPQCLPAVVMVLIEWNFGKVREWVVVGSGSSAFFFEFWPTTDSNTIQMGRRRHTGKQPHEHNLVKSRWKWTVFFGQRMGQHLIPFRNIIDFPKLPKITGTAYHCQDLTESGSETTKVRIWDRKTAGSLWLDIFSNRFLLWLCHVFSP